MQYTNKHNLPFSTIVWLLNSTYNLIPKDNLISATTLLKPVKEIVLSPRVYSGKTIDISDLIAATLGQSIHTAIEQSWLSPEGPASLQKLGLSKDTTDRIKINPSEIRDNDIPVYLEKRVTKELAGMKISGKYDIIISGKLEDFKSTSVYGYIYGTNDTNHILQGSIYRWLNPDKITENQMCIQYIFTDWSSSRAKQDPTYPPTRIISKELNLLPIPVIEKWLVEKVEQIKKYQDADQKLIPECTSEHLWEKPTLYKYYSNPEKRTRSTKTSENYWEVLEKSQKHNGKGVIITIPGKIIKCNYCSALPICTQAAGYIQQGRLDVQS